MRGTHAFSGLARLRGIGLTTLAALLLTLAGRTLLPWDQLFPDVICYWTAGKILAAGQNPYDAALQTEIQQDYGWDKATRGFGLFDYLPYYYPPWFGLLWVLLVPLGYAAAKTVWFFVNLECTLLAGYLLRRSVPGVPAWVPMVVASLFLFSVACVVLGQTALVIFFLIVLLWRLLEQRQDAWAGVALAWLTIKLGCPPAPLAGGAGLFCHRGAALSHQRLDRAVLAGADVGRHPAHTVAHRLLPVDRQLLAAGAEGLRVTVLARLRPLPGRSAPFSWHSADGGRQSEGSPGRGARGEHFGRFLCRSLRPSL
ncbi:MAG: DUF2029 domain-containing protein [Planctomycetota bacterium]|nr:MAG: DUF2029 domain-containing protein [Planctomycetota bacterium]